MQKNLKKESKYLISFTELFRFRSVWMFVAIIWVMLFHSPIAFPEGFNFIRKIGYGGVDIFLFASGLGCYFSLCKQPNIKSFFKKRLSTIFPMWAVFLVIYLVFQFCLYPMSISEVVGNVFGLGFFAGLERQFNWYIGAMWACYTLAPLFVSLVRNTKNVYKIIFLAMLGVFSVVFFDHSTLMFWSRLPIFFMGILTADLSTKKRGLTLAEIIITIITMLLGFVILNCCNYYCSYLLVPRGLYWYPFILIVPGFVLVISLTSSFISKTPLKFITDISGRLGRHTFSFYLAHIFVFDFFSLLYLKEILPKGVPTFLASIAISIVFALCLHFATKFVKYIFSLFSKNT